MPQLDQLADVALSQFFWLAIVLGVIYFIIGKGMLPKIQSTVDLRESKIADDLAAAEAARKAADTTEEAYRLRMDESRGAAGKLTAEAKDKGARHAEKKLGDADTAIKAKLAEAEARIAAARSKSVAEIEAAVADLAGDITRQIARIDVSKTEATAAAKAVLGHA